MVFYLLIFLARARHAADRVRIQISLEFGGSVYYYWIYELWRFILKMDMTVVKNKQKLNELFNCMKKG